MNPDNDIIADFACEAAATYAIQGRGTVYYVSNPRDVEDNNDWSWLIGHKVRLNGRVVTVLGVERYAIGGVYRAGRPIGLLVKEEETL